MDNFLEASKALHRENSSYGKASEYLTRGSMKYEMRIPEAVAAVHKIQSIHHILDHGCGKGGLVEALNQNALVEGKADGYDPAIKEFSQKPKQTYDLVTSIDVLEHIGRENISSTIAEIKQLSSGFFFFCIDLIPATKKTCDRRNAHFLIAPSDWWLQQIKSHFKAVTAIEVGQMPDNTPYPLHLFGCATNIINNFHAMNEFLNHIPLANKEWIWDTTRRGIVIRSSKSKKS